MSDRLQGKVAFVTGGGSGIGEATARRFAREGATVVICGRRKELLDGVVAAIVADGGRAEAVQVDVSNESQYVGAINDAAQRHGRLDVLVNNAAIAVNAARVGGLAAMRRSGAPSEAALDDVRAVFETNVFGVIAVTQAMLPLLRESPAGRIVNLSSRIGSLTVITDPAFPMRGVGGVAYGPSKTALNAVTVAFAQELEGTAVKVNLVCPGHTATDLNGHSGARTVTEAAREPVRLALLGPEGPTGTFTNEDGPIPW